MNLRPRWQNRPRLSNVAAHLGLRSRVRPLESGLAGSCCGQACMWSRKSLALVVLGAKVPVSGAGPDNRARQAFSWVLPGVAGALAFALPSHLLWIGEVERLPPLLGRTLASSLDTRRARR